MSIKLPTEPLFILYSLKRAGYDAYLVGGAVRDLLRQASDNSIKVTDYDFTTNATPEQIMAVFPENFYENKFGTVSVNLDDVQKELGIPAEESYFWIEKQQQAQIDLSQAAKLHESLTKPDSTNQANVKSVPPFEITTYRSDGEYQDHRRPESVAWGDSLNMDLDRRDFTINAMAIDVQMSVLEKLFLADLEYLPKLVEIKDEKFNLIDPHGGAEDLSLELIRTVGDPNQRFTEDALRMLRAIRFSVQLNMKMDDHTFSAINQQAKLIEHISWERIRDEFFKMLVSDYPKQAIELMDETGLLAYILPELLTTKGVKQGGHHTTDVWTHSLNALAECPSPDPIVRFATLLHDIAKPTTAAEKNGDITFYNHEIVGSRIAKQIAIRFKLSNDEVQRIFILVRYHMFHYQTFQTDAAVRRFMRKVGLENINDILDLREGDRLGSGASKTSWRLEEMKERMMEQLNQPFSATDLQIDGNDLINELGLKPGPTLGRIIDQLVEEVIETPEINTKEQLLNRSREIVNQQN